MLLWHDSLEYATNYLLATYPGATGFGVGEPHELSGRTCLSFASPGTLQVPAWTATSDTLFVGFLMKAADLGSMAGGTLLEFLSGGSTVRLRAATSVTGVDATVLSIYFESPSSAERFLISPTIPLGTWNYIEIKAVFQNSQGSIVLRINGVEAGRVENISLDTFLPNTIRFNVNSNAIRFSLADLYVCDGTGSDKTFRTFLGKVTSQRLFPFRADVGKFGWGPDIQNSGKYKLILMCGQSNINGRGSLPTFPQPWRSPNTKVPIWHADHGVFEPLQAGVNTWGAFVGYSQPLWGPEMMLAERIAALYEQSGMTGTTPVRIIKLAQDASFVVNYGIPPDYSWNPADIGGLYSRALSQMFQAINYGLLGTPSIERVDVFWYQGESESSFNLAFDGSPSLYEQGTLDCLLGLVFGAAPGVPVTLHLTKIHKDEPAGYFPFIERARGQQEWLSNILSQGRLISVDDLSFGIDTIHLDNKSLNNLGERYFESWIAQQGFAEDLKDYYYSASVDGKWVGSDSTSKEVQYEQLISFQLNMLHAPMMAASSMKHLESTADGKNLEISIGQATLASEPLGTYPAWTLSRKMTPRIRAPEDFYGNLSLKLS